MKPAVLLKVILAQNISYWYFINVITQNLISILEHYPKEKEKESSI